MGFGLPAAIGAQFASATPQSINVTGDARSCMNVQAAGGLFAVIRLPAENYHFWTTSACMVRQQQGAVFTKTAKGTYNLDGQPDLCRYGAGLDIPALQSTARFRFASVAIETFYFGL